MLQLLFVPQPESFRVRSIGGFVAALGMLIFYIGTLAFFVLFVWGGLEWLTSGGDKGKLQSARERITYALIGLTILGLARAILLVLEIFFGICIVGDCSPLLPGY